MLLVSRPIIRLKSQQALQTEVQIVAYEEVCCTPK